MSDDKKTRGEIEKAKRHEELLKRIGKRVIELRKERLPNTSYGEFAEKYGINRTSQYRLEKGENFMIINLIKFCEGINMSLEEFFEGL